MMAAAPVSRSASPGEGWKLWTSVPGARRQATRNWGGAIWRAISSKIVLVAITVGASGDGDAVAKVTAMKDRMIQRMGNRLNAICLRRKGLVLVLALCAAADGRGDSFVRWESGNVFAEVPDLLRAVGDPAFRNEIAVETVELIGVWEIGPDGVVSLTRKITHCCEREAVKVGVEVRGIPADAALIGAWTRVAGRPRFEPGSRVEVWIEADTVRAEPEPEEDEWLLRIED